MNGKDSVIEKIQEDLTPKSPVINYNNLPVHSPEEPVTVAPSLSPKTTTLSGRTARFNLRYL